VKRRRRVEVSNPISLVIVVLAPPFVVLVWLAFGEVVRNEAALILVALYLILLVGVGLQVSRLHRESQIRGADSRPGFGDASLVPVSTVPGTTAPLNLSVIGASEWCPDGFRIGQGMNIDDGGRLSSPLCRFAVEALAAAADDARRGGCPETQFSCWCPVTDRGLTFRLEPAVRTA
jgi:hypothetical protein